MTVIIIIIMITYSPPQTLLCDNKYHAHVVNSIYVGSVFLKNFTAAETCRHGSSRSSSSCLQRRCLRHGSSMSVPFSLTRPQGLMRSPLGNASHEALAIHRPRLLLVEACPPFPASEFVQKEMMQIQHISEGNGALFLEIFCYMLPFQETNLELTDKDVVMLKKEHGRALAHGCLKPTLSQAGCPHRPRCPPRLP